MTRSKLYAILLAACGAGWIWIGIQSSSFSSGPRHEVGVCLIKQVTTLPCPSCGTTRSVFALMEGDFAASIQWNPFGLLVASLMVLIPIWITFDALFKRDSFLYYYRRSERWLSSKWIAGPAIVLVLANWAWNICKGL